MDISRLNASLSELEQNLEELKNKINGFPIPFVFNLDEFGQQDYVDAIEKQFWYQQIIRDQQLNVQ